MKSGPRHQGSLMAAGLHKGHQGQHAGQLDPEKAGSILRLQGKVVQLEGPTVEGRLQQQRELGEEARG